MFLAIAVALTATPAMAGKVADAIAYLNEIEEVAGVRVISGNDVWVAFKTKPADSSVILRAAAYKANVAYGSGAHVYLTTPSGLAQAPNMYPLCEACAEAGGADQAALMESRLQILANRRKRAE